jgi:hypothetical protein
MSKQHLMLQCQELTIGNAAVLRASFCTCILMFVVPGGVLGDETPRSKLLSRLRNHHPNTSTTITNFVQKPKRQTTRASRNILRCTEDIQTKNVGTVAARD